MRPGASHFSQQLAEARSAAWTHALICSNFSLGDLGVDSNRP
jgi:hypothetical protein